MRNRGAADPAARGQHRRKGIALCSGFFSCDAHIVSPAGSLASGIESLGSPGRIATRRLADARLIEPSIGRITPNGDMVDERVDLSTSHNAGRLRIERFDGTVRGSLPAGQTWWDGRDEDGQMLPAGRYLVIFEPDARDALREVALVSSERRRSFRSRSTEPGILGPL